MPVSPRRLRHAVCGTIAFLCALPGLATAQTGAAPEAPPPVSSTAERIYAAARPKLMQIRTLVAAAGRQSALGSGFLVGDGLALTNYHVVSQYALEPKNYRLEYTMADGGRGDVTLLAVDIANDLALVRVDRTGDSHFDFDARALADSLSKGERLYSMGNPLNLGFTIIEGTYNGRVENSYVERVLFSGAINPGMSGGPAVTPEGAVAGVNVAKRTDGELVSFLVPARFALALLERARAAAAPPPEGLRAEIAGQLREWQAGLYKAVVETGFRTSSFGPYQASESAAPWFTCWAQTNAGEVPKPRAEANATICNSDTRLFISGDLYTGTIQLQHTHYRSVDLNAFQFAAFITQNNRPYWFGGWRPKWYTRQRCNEDFVAFARDADHPPLRVAWCARAYREFEGLYDIWLVAVTQDRGDEALVSRLNMQSVTHENAMALATRFLETLQWKK